MAFVKRFLSVKGFSLTFKCRTVAWACWARRRVSRVAYVDQISNSLPTSHWHTQADRTQKSETKRNRALYKWYKGIELQEIYTGRKKLFGIGQRLTQNLTVTVAPPARRLCNVVSETCDGLTNMKVFTRHFSKTTENGLRWNYCKWMRFQSDTHTKKNNLRTNFELKRRKVGKTVLVPVKRMKRYLAL